MSLLVFNSSNKIAQSVIRHLHATQQFEKIICADLYPSYWQIQRHLNFLPTLSKTSKTVLTDTKISERSDLEREVAKSTHILYVTHDYYKNTSSKLNLIKSTAEIASKRKGLKKFIALTPIEHTHMHEQQPFKDAQLSENRAREVLPDLVHIKADLTFGEGTIVSYMERKISQGKNFYWKPSSQKPKPVCTDDLAKAVEVAFKNDQLKAAKILAQGPREVEWKEFLEWVEKVTGGLLAKVNGNALEGFLLPSDNILTEMFYHEDYIQFAKFVNAYQSIDNQGFQDLKSLGINAKDLKDDVEKHKIDVSKQQQPSTSQILAKCIFY